MYILKLTTEERMQLRHLLVTPLGVEEDPDGAAGLLALLGAEAKRPVWQGLGEKLEHAVEEGEEQTGYRFYYYDRTLYRTSGGGDGFDVYLDDGWEPAVPSEQDYNHMRRVTIEEAREHEPGAFET